MARTKLKFRLHRAVIVLFCLALLVALMQGASWFSQNHQRQRNPQLEELTRKVRAGLGDKQVFRKNKQTLLPYVTPAGIFSYCKEQCMQVPSGLFVIDIDELASTEEAAMWRDRLFADEVLHPVLSFVSPGNQGVKLFIPYRINPFLSVEESFDNALHTAWEYLEWKYELKVDRANADLSRACFLSHDGEAKINNHKY